MVTFIYSLSNNINRAWLNKGTSRNFNKLPIMSVSFFQYQPDMSFSLFSNSTFVKEILLASFFFIGFFTCCRFSFFIGWKLLAYKYNAVLKEYERISGVKVPAPTDAFSKQIKRNIELFEQILLPWRFIFDLVSNGLTTVTKFYAWKYNNYNHITSVFTLQSVTKDVVKYSSKGMPEWKAKTSYK